MKKQCRMHNSKFLDNPDLQLILFGGKGGSGKTTSATSTALHLNKIKPEKKILVMSTDPAHSLGDSFNIIIGSKITHIVRNIWGYEIDATELLEKYKAEHGVIMRKIAERGTYFDKEDIENFFCGSLPGLDEIMAIIKVANILNSKEYDIVILDTAPTGHTTVLLSLPEKMENWVEVMDMMMEKHRYMARRFVGKYVKDECDKFLKSQREDVGKVKRLLTNSKTTEFVPVTIPEPMSIYEVERLIQILNKDRIPVNSVIANRIIMPACSVDSSAGLYATLKCPFCLAMEREQEKYVKEIEEKLGSYNLLKMPLFPDEIRGIENLTKYAEILFGENEYKLITLLPDYPITDYPIKGGMENLLVGTRHGVSLQLIIFGGKGGVGKTSIASATALRLAGQNKNKKILIFSTDPAHSLSESFNQLVGNKFTLVTGTENLYALELDATQMLKDLKEEYRGDIEDVFDKFLSSGMDIKFDKEVMEELVTVTPPGLEELMALKKITELIRASNYDCFVMDSSASGHLLRFLEMPHIVREWLKTMLRLLLKYRGIINLSTLHSVESLLELSRDVRKIQELLANPETTEFVMITIPEEMGVREMDDLSLALRNLKIPCSHTVINMIQPLPAPHLPDSRQAGLVGESDCDFCTAKRIAQQKYIQAIERSAGLYAPLNSRIIYAPLFPHAIGGKESLNELAEIMFSKR